MERDWNSVLSLLSSLIAFKNRADANGWRDAFENMPVYLERISVKDEIKILPVIHIAGTKGKGSTCAMAESMLRRCGYKTGLYTSPHLVDVRERIRINGEMVGKDVFERWFWWCHDRFKDAATPEVGVPGYFRFLTLLGFKIFLEAKVDVLVLEVGIGGRLDATNVVPAPVVCGITSLGYDHTEMLGDTLTLIAGEKAGIMKPGRPAITVPQPEEAMLKLCEVSKSVGAPLKVADPLVNFPGSDGKQLRLALQGSHQLLNASLAVQLVSTFERDRLAQGCAAAGAAERLEQLQLGNLPREYVEGLEHVEWPGRSQVVHDDGIAFHLDGAHTPESMLVVADWYADVACSSGSSNNRIHWPDPQVPRCSSGSEPSAASDGAQSRSIVGQGTVERSSSSMEPSEGRLSAEPCLSGVSQVQDGPQEDAHVLLFNCTQDRDPAKLLPILHQRMMERGIYFSAALFVPPESTTAALRSASPTPNTPDSPGSSTPNYPLGTDPRPRSNSLGSMATTDSPVAASRSRSGSESPSGVDLSWQASMQQIWAEQCLRRQANSKSGGFDAGVSLWQKEAGQGLVIPRLDAALERVRHWGRISGNTRLKVLVTGSLYLVGDVLRLLGKLR